MSSNGESSCAQTEHSNIQQSHLSTGIGFEFRGIDVAPALCNKQVLQKVCVKSCSIVVAIIENAQSYKITHTQYNKPSRKVFFSKMVLLTFAHVWSPEASHIPDSENQWHTAENTMSLHCIPKTQRTGYHGAEEASHATIR